MNIRDVIQSVFKGFDKIVELFPNSNKLTAIGHSVGAHLIAMVMQERPRVKIDHAVLISGLYEIAPVINSDHAEDLCFTE